VILKRDLQFVTFVAQLDGTAVAQRQDAAVRTCIPLQHAHPKTTAPTRVLGEYIKRAPRRSNRTTACSRFW
jgi:hypothetical protein